MKQIFVFGSNLAGIHGAGAARVALKLHGAIPGEGFGLYNESYAIPTKDQNIESFTLNQVRYYVNCFVEDARRCPHMAFKVTRIGCGLAGFKDEDIAPMFVNAGVNCEFDSAWKPWLPGKRFWGTF